MTVNNAADASSSAPSPSPAMPIIIANAAILPNDAITDARTPSFAPFESEQHVVRPESHVDGEARRNEQRKKSAAS
jgi:hypothetical protein